MLLCIKGGRRIRKQLNMAEMGIQNNKMRETDRNAGNLDTGREYKGWDVIGYFLLTTFQPFLPISSVFPKHTPRQWRGTGFYYYFAVK